MKKIFKKIVMLLSLCFVLGITSSQEVDAKTTKELDKMEVHFIDVGQGDATLIKCGDSAMLIDAGDNDKGTLVQNYLKKQGVKSLDYLIVTHPDADHSGGADVIITKYNIGKVIVPNYEKDTNTYRDVIKAMDYKRVKPTKAVVGDTYKLGDAEFTIIAPNDKYEDSNNNSVSIILKHGDKKFIFTGDAESESEKDIISNKINIKADVLQVGHHGSKTASTSAFIKKVKPTYAVISCGEGNEYGHPHAAALNNLRTNKVKLFRTDEQGSLIAESSGKEIKWNAAPTETWQAGEAKGSSKKETKPIAKTPTEQPKVEEVTPTPIPAPVVEAPKEPQPVQNNTSLTYVLNVKSKKFHSPSCGSLPTTNRSDSSLSREEVVAQGYDSCGRCKP